MSAGRKDRTDDFARPLAGMHVEHVYLDAPLKAQRRPWDARAVERLVLVTIVVAAFALAALAGLFWGFIHVGN